MKRTAWKKEREKRFPTWTFPRSSSAFWSVCDLPVCRSPSWRIVRFVMKEGGSNWTGEIDSKRVDNVPNWRTVLEWDLREVWIETKNWNDREIWRGGFEKFRNRIERSRGWPERWLKCVERCVTRCAGTVCLDNSDCSDWCSDCLDWWRCV